MENNAPAAGQFRPVQVRTNSSVLSPSDFAWEILRRQAGYRSGPAPNRRILGGPSGKPVTLIDCDAPGDRSSGLLFRGGS